MSASQLEVILLSNASATGDPVEWPGGEGQVSLAGTVNGATVTLQALAADGSTYVAVGTDTTFTAVGMAGFKLTAGTMIRALVAGGTPSGLYMKAQRI